LNRWPRLTNVAPDRSGESDKRDGQGHADHLEKAELAHFVSSQLLIASVISPQIAYGTGKRTHLVFAQG
jgi:hypothetical protein